MSAEIMHVLPKINFNGEQMDFVFVNKAIKYLKNKYGKFIDAIKNIDGEDGEIDLDVVGEIVFAGLMCNKNAPDRQAVFNWLEDLSIAETVDIARNKVVLAMTSTFPEVKEEKSPN